MNNTLAGALAPHIVSKIWGGDKLKDLRALSQDLKKVGETWDISQHSDGPSRYQGQALNEVLTQNELPYLVKTIDTSEELSVQVHPGDEYARQYENSLGKTECWLVLDAGADAGIYLGFKAGVGETEFFSALENGDDVSKLLNFYPVKGGEFFFVPSGSVHAIGKNVTLAEVQQSSGITYRVWDWNRLDDKGQARELHVQKARDVLNFKAECNTKEFFNFKDNLLSAPRGKTVLANHPQFELTLVSLRAGESISATHIGGRAISLLPLNETLVEYEFAGSEGLVDQKRGFLFYESQKKSPLNLKSRGDSLFLLIR